MHVPTDEEQQRYLAAVRQGQPRPVAARLAHPELTGTAFRGLASRDQAFAAQLQDAEAEGHGALQDLTRAAIQRRALSTEERSTKALEMQAATILPEYAWLKRGGYRGGDGDDMTVPFIDRTLLTRAQKEQLLLLIEYGQGQRPNPELEAERRQIASAHPVIDA